ncbi:copper resistance CopC family protein [Rarobacter incanus]|uniref:CopC domain-containing protein n=1 Tax=Rarobacter incanus TaxID=153494 RepID=A0A542SRP5_9MICO|nr:copper resistance CopC family protein [Rarobacter incanus]TQK76907.1 hypothetical protein FB389_1609 [Rarobacter incanus]
MKNVLARAFGAPTLFACAAAVVVAGIAGAPLAYAHDALLGANPADGAKIKVLPGELKLTFSESVLDTGAAIKVVGPDDERWDNDDATVSGDQVETTLRDDAPAGTYTVTWRVVSSDAHPISGTYAFTVTTGAVPAKSQDSTASPEDGAAATGAQDATDGTQGAAGAAQDGSGSAQSQGTPGGAAAGEPDAGATAAAADADAATAAATDRAGRDSGSGISRLIGAAVIGALAGIVTYLIYRAVRRSAPSRRK